MHQLMIKNTSQYMLTVYECQILDFVSMVHHQVLKVMVLEQGLLPVHRQT